MAMDISSNCGGGWAPTLQACILTWETLGLHVQALTKVMLARRVDLLRVMNGAKRAHLVPFLSIRDTVREDGMSGCCRATDS